MLTVHYDTQCGEWKQMYQQCGVVSKRHQHNVNASGHIFQCKKVANANEDKLFINQLTFKSEKSYL